MLKLAAVLLSGSAALLAEAAHSAGDTSTELLLVSIVITALGLGLHQLTGSHTCQALLIGKQDDAGLMRRVDFENGFSGADLEHACVRMDALLRKEFPTLDEVLIQPAPKSDTRVQARVRARYGRQLADDS